MPLFNPLGILPFGPQDIQQLQQHIQQQQQNLQNLQKMLLLQSGQLNPSGLQALLLQQQGNLLSQGLLQQGLQNLTTHGMPLSQMPVTNEHLHHLQESQHTGMVDDKRSSTQPINKGNGKKQPIFPTSLPNSHQTSKTVKNGDEPSAPFESLTHLDDKSRFSQLTRKGLDSAESQRTKTNFNHGSRLETSPDEMTDLEELEQFAKMFKQRRIKLGRLFWDS